MRLAQIIKQGNKVLLAGNGGSAADAQHFAGEIVGRFLMERNAIPALSLCVDPSVMTCIGNDYGYEEVFARQVRGLGGKEMPLLEFQQVEIRKISSGQSLKQERRICLLLVFWEKTEEK